MESRTGKERANSINKLALHTTRPGYETKLFPSLLCRGTTLPNVERGTRRGTLPNVERGRKVYYDSLSE
uniref:Uncharacterized protein n=1 Tax=Picea glauca TaxID=3330 RepID=A0A101LZC4_PICGL|nr:hypothetical protein ABT39_MTgene5142 [Picea glauca]